MNTALAKTLFLATLLALSSCERNEISDNSRCISSFGETGERNAHAMIFDESRGHTLLFGGADASGVCGDTWEWDGSSWENSDQGGPSPRTFPAMAYDPTTARTFLFGGSSVLFGEKSWWPFGSESTLLGDTWVRSDESWQLLSATGPAPGARAEAAVSFDAARGRLVLFGGYTVEEGENISLGDTWEFDGERWEQMSGAGPDPANGATMIYDPSRQRSVLFTHSTDRSKSETWEWDGVQWQYVATADSPARYNVSLSYDDDVEQIIRFGGWDGSHRVSETWLYDGETWSATEGDSPPARNHSAMVYDSEAGHTVLYGGHEDSSVFADMWQFSDDGWSPLLERPPVLRADNGH